MRTSTAAGLRARLQALESLSAPVRRPNADDAASARLRATVGAEFGVAGPQVFRAANCPALAWLGRIVDGDASQDERETFERVARVGYFEKVETGEYLRAVVRVHRDF
jgi:hypothetical protein